MNSNVLIVSGNDSYLNKWSGLVKEVRDNLDVYTADRIETACKVFMDYTIDVFVLDVTMVENVAGDTSGLWLAGQIRQIPRYVLTPIIFIAPVEDSQLYAYKELNCLGYLKRPFETGQLKFLLAKALHYRTQREDDKWIVFRGQGRLYPVRASDVVFIVNEDHILKLHLCSGEVREMSYKSLGMLLLEADVECLFQCSRSAIVNKNYIACIDISRHCIHLTGGRGNVEIGFTYRKKITEEFRINNETEQNWKNL